MDKQFVILRYLAKIEDSGLITDAHKKCMVASGNDYSALSEDNKIIEKTDYAIDKNKLSALFQERDTMTESEFNSAVSSLETAGLIDSNFKATANGITEWQNVETAWLNSAECAAQLADQLNPPE